jgi:hypothetical protein
MHTAEDIKLQRRANEATVESLHLTREGLHLTRKSVWIGVASLVVATLGLAIYFVDRGNRSPGADKASGKEIATDPPCGQTGKPSALGYDPCEQALKIFSGQFPTPVQNDIDKAPSAGTPPTTPQADSEGRREEGLALDHIPVPAVEPVPGGPPYGMYTVEGLPSTRAPAKPLYVSLLDAFNAKQYTLTCPRCGQTQTHTAQCIANHSTFRCQCGAKIKAGRLHDQLQEEERHLRKVAGL